MDETAACPWCGGHLWNPFSGMPVREGSKHYDQALEAHVEDCEPWLEENGER